ncbi:MAG: amino acid adenylation domain-containing protein [Ignavibacteriaceae bacterium]|nr:amino acid adenylation domain-containing protein [Ignavibacteriaceae bacterium]
MSDVRKLTSERQALLEKRLKGISLGKSVSSSIPKRKKNDIIPLSDYQEPLWIIDNLEPGNPAYNVPVAYRLKGELNLQKIKESLNKVIERHETLRTTIERHGNEVVQVIHENLKVIPEYIDLENIPVNDSWSKLKILLSEKAGKRFNLSKLPLLSLTLFKLSINEYVLFINMHHIISSGISAGILIRELFAFYEGNNEILSELDIQYADYTIWEKSRVNRETQKSQLDYWKSTLGDQLPVLDFPIDKSRPSLPTNVGANHFFSLPKSLCASLNEIGSKSGCTLFMTLLSAYYVLLRRYSNQNDIIIGVPVVNRNLKELENLIGYFINITAFRIKTITNISFLELLSQVRDITIDAFANQDIAFNKIVENLNFSRDLGHNPIFQTLFEFTANMNLQFPNFQISRVPVDNKYSQLDISLHINEEKDEYLCRFEYNTNLFDETTLIRLSNNFRYLLQQIIEHPNESISNISLIAPRESHLVFDEFVFSPAEFICESTLHQMFEKTANIFSDKIAIEYDNTTLTYKELNIKSNQVANFLQKKGVHTEILVAVNLNRSLNLIIWLLGILKAGGAYIPLDTGYPKERLNFMLQDSAVSFLVTEKEFVETFSEFSGLKVCIEEVQNLINSEDDNFTIGDSRLDNAAYVIYTSGSTGTPKGVINTHKGITNYLTSLQNYYKVNSSDVGLQKTPISFDVSVREIFLPLISGAKLILAKPDGHKDNAYLIELIRTKEITLLSFVPSQLSVFLMEKDVSKCKTIRQVICSGEVLSTSIQKIFFNNLSSELDNLYGPTEAAVDVTRWRCINDTESGFIPIGKPITNNRIYILDGNDQQVPIGVYGEICIGGIQVARGYLNRQDLTSEKFVHDPLSIDSSNKIYKTGDIGRFLIDGNIEYKGRRDNQIKIRGFRVELGEIESILIKNKNLKDVVVLLRERNNEDKIIVAYYIPNDQNISIGDLKRYAKERLPEYMIPAYFVKMDVFPLTPSGKIDRKSFPEVDSILIENDLTENIPQNNLENEIMKIWENHLGVKNIGVKNNFFEIGGNSLLAIKLIYELNDKFNIDLPLSIIFDAPSISKLSIEISKFKN